MADDPARSEHYATQAVLGAAVRLVGALDAEPIDRDEVARSEFGLREAVRLWQEAVGGQVVVTEPPVHAVTVRPGDTLVVAFPDADAEATGAFDALRMMRRSLPDVELVLFGGTIHGRSRPDAPADEPGPMPRLEDVEHQDPDFPRG